MTAARWVAQNSLGYKLPCKKGQSIVDEKIDIEVDGEAFHLNKFGERKQDDIYRDLQVASVGWRVCRFWYREVRDNLNDCVAKVQQLTKSTGL